MFIRTTTILIFIFFSKRNKFKLTEHKTHTHIFSKSIYVSHRVRKNILTRVRRQSKNKRFPPSSNTSKNNSVSFVLFFFFNSYLNETHGTRTLHVYRISGSNNTKNCRLYCLDSQRFVQI